MTVPRKQKAQHKTGTSHEQHRQHAQPETAATTRILGEHFAILFVATLLSATVDSATAAMHTPSARGAQARIAATRLTPECHRGRFQIEPRKRRSLCARGVQERSLLLSRNGLCCSATERKPKRCHRGWWHFFGKQATATFERLRCIAPCGMYMIWFGKLARVAICPMSFDELGLSAPLEALITTAAKIHNPRTCMLECCAGMRIQTVVTPAGTRLRPPPLSCASLSGIQTTGSLSATNETLEPLETIKMPVPSETRAVPFYMDVPDSPSSTVNLYEREDDTLEDAFATAIAEEEMKPVRSLAEREQATCYCVLAVHSTGMAAHDCVLQCVVKGFDAEGNATVGYDRLWLLPYRVKITAKAFKRHGIHYRDLREAGEPPAEEIREVMQMMNRLVNVHGARLIIHNAKVAVRLLRQTAARHGIHEDVWQFPFNPTCVASRSRRIVNLPSKTNPKMLAIPTEREVYRHLFKKGFDEEEPDVACISELARTCTVTLQNFLAGAGRGWWS